MGRSGFVILAISLLGAAPSVPSEDVGFAQPPALSKKGNGAVVTFALSKSSDVEVAVLNGAGEVVRHLAAGVLGGKQAPPPPLRPGLAQSLEWEGLDDFGKPAAGGPFMVRVRAGMGVALGRFVGEDPYTFGSISSISADETGRLYVGAFVGGLNQNMDTLRVFGSDGVYERTLIPFSETLEPSRAAAFPRRRPASRACSATACSARWAPASRTS